MRDGDSQPYSVPRAVFSAPNGVLEHVDCSAGSIIGPTPPSDYEVIPPILVRIGFRGGDQREVPLFASERVFLRDGFF